MTDPIKTALEAMRADGVGLTGGQELMLRQIIGPDLAALASLREELAAAKKGRAEAQKGHAETEVKLMAAIQREATERRWKEKAESDRDAARADARKANESLLKLMEAREPSDKAFSDLKAEVERLKAANAILTRQRDDAISAKWEEIRALESALKRKDKLLKPVLEGLLGFRACMEAQRIDKELPPGHDDVDESCGDGVCFKAGATIDQDIAALEAALSASEEAAGAVTEPGDSLCHFCNGPMPCYCKKPAGYDEESAGEAKPKFTEGSSKNYLLGRKTKDGAVVCESCEKPNCPGPWSHVL